MPNITEGLDEATIKRFQEASTPKELEGLDDIPWNTLSHAYGSADDVPTILKAIVLGNSEEQRKAMWELWGNIWHQGTIYPATPYAVPFLAKLAKSQEVEEEIRADLIGMLAFITDPFNQKPGSEELVKTAQEAVAKEVPSILERIENEQQLIQLFSVNLASQMPEASKEALNSLKKLKELTNDQAWQILLELALKLVEDEPISNDLLAKAESIAPNAASYISYMQEANSPLSTHQKAQVCTKELTISIYNQSKK